MFDNIEYFVAYKADAYATVQDAIKALDDGTANNDALRSTFNGTAYDFAVKNSNKDTYFVVGLDRFDNVVYESKYPN